MRFPEFPVIGFLAAVLVLVPLPRQIRAGNIACIALIFWFFQHCLVAAINSIIWAGNVNNVAPVWCDITNKLRDVCFVQTPNWFDSSQRRRKIFELVMCFGIPVLWMFLFYCFQTVRFFISENFGCSSGRVVNDGVTALLHGPALIFSVITLIYGFAALFHLIKNHQTNVNFLAPYLKSRDSALSGRQYYRLMAMSMILGLWGVVWISIEIHFNATKGSFPIPSWNDIHEGDSEIIELPTILLGSTFIHRAYTLWWAVPGAALLFFLLFGTSYDVLYEYVKFWAWFRTRVLKQTVREKAVAMSPLRLPSYRIDTSTIHDDDLDSKLPVI